MLRTLLLSSTLSVLIMAQTTPPSVVQPLDIKAYTTQIINETITTQKEKGGWTIENRKLTPKGETFDALLTPVKGIAKDAPINDMVGLKFNNEINYTKETIDTRSLLTGFPKTKKIDPKIIEKIIATQAIEIDNHYSTLDKRYTLSLKDINDDFGKAKVEVANTLLTGVYNPDNLLEQESNLSVGLVHITPNTPPLLGQSLRLDNLSIASYTLPIQNVSTLKHHISLASLESNISKKGLSFKDFTLDTTLGNIDSQTYNTLISFMQENPSADFTHPELNHLLTTIVTLKDFYLSIDTLSIDALTVEDETLGRAKITAKVSLTPTPNLAQLIAISPLMALSSLDADAHIELSSAMYAMLLRDPKGMMLQMVKPKRENDKVIYDIAFKKGEILINGKPFNPFPKH